MNNTDTINHSGRIFGVLARFSGENRIAQANAYMELHPHAAVLTERDGAVIVADERDLGVLATEAANDPGAAGEVWEDLFSERNTK